MAISIITVAWRKALLSTWFIVQFIQYELILEMLSEATDILAVHTCFVKHLLEGLFLTFDYFFFKGLCC